MGAGGRADRRVVWLRILLSLALVSAVYFLAIRPIESFAVRKLIHPFFASLIGTDSGVAAALGVDEIFLLSTRGQFPRLYVDIPFSGWFWLAMALIWPTKNKRLGRVIWIYNWALVLIIPFFAIGIINGWVFLAPVAYIHQRVYRVVFVAVAVAAVAGAVRESSRPTASDEGRLQEMG